ncbi:hypothetical protein M409DRAFT_21066 [Zasmidium cellare ATCC 36951]|uniref:SnoaL-like domain-containing protein n=1 Tax=Zasmidium cellare ATCC 36951 TaxID=1080233 RepID=A0A6A6CP58_ZASCE|nr:uncharacterized protein M409DRAFT_21066 [Zasmidium cellare ATCC 36951]KAF2169057.1 hypothetical protein M409DRAFT_21066 [Zasmidium cellare ATCC 36951]
MSNPEGAAKWAAAFIQDSWKDVMIGEATEAAMKETLLKYTTASVRWTVDGELLAVDKLAKYCAQLRGRMQSVKVEVHDLITEKQDGYTKLANRHICYFLRTDGSTVSNECFQIMKIDNDGLITEAVEVARNFDDSRDGDGENSQG